MLGSIRNRLYVQITQDQVVPEQTQTQENVQTSIRMVKLVDLQNSPAAPIERKIIGTNAENFEGLKEEFVRQILSIKLQTPL